MQFCNRLPVFIAIPVCNEAERIGACLAALAVQDEPGPAEVLLLLNNCTDDTAGIARQWLRDARLRLRLHEVTLPAEAASAGMARSMAMRLAADLAGARPGGQVLLTSDADSVAPPGWVRGNIDAIAAGADAVCGCAVIDPAEAALIPQRLHADDAQECAYAAMLDEIASLLDPDPADPWPRHSENSGASIAVRCDVYHAAGGVPNVRSGEDRAFVAALRRIDARVRHAPEIAVTVSGRIVGRAEGGMADTIRRRMAAPDSFLDDRLEGASAAARRAVLRRVLRGVHRGEAGAPAGVADALCVGQRWLAALLDTPRFGTAWAAVEAASPALRRVPVPMGAIGREMDAAKMLLERLWAVGISGWGADAGRARGRAGRRPPGQEPENDMRLVYWATATGRESRSSR